MTNETQNPMADKSTCASTVAQLPTAGMLNIEIKKTWNKLSDEDVALHATQPEQFFAKIKEQYGADKEEAQKRLAAIKAACGTCTAEKAA